MPAYTFTIPNLPGQMTVTCTSDSQKDAIKEAHFWQSLPTVCPIDGTPTIFCFREPNDNAYYSVISTGFPVYEYKIGQHKTGGTLFAKEEWVLFDGTSETVLWSRGKLTQAGEKARSSHGRGQEHRATTTSPTPPPATEKIASPEPPPTTPDPPTPPPPTANGHSAASQEYAAIPGKSATGTVEKATDHQLQRIREEAARIYGPTWADNGNEKNLAQWASNNGTETFATLNRTEAKRLLDALLRRANQAKETAQ